MIVLGAILFFMSAVVLRYKLFLVLFLGMILFYIELFGTILFSRLVLRYDPFYVEYLLTVDTILSTSST